MEKIQKQTGWLIWFIFKGRSQTTLTRFSVFLTTYPPALTFSIVWTLTKSGYFWTTYLPRLVNVVCERPLRHQPYLTNWLKILLGLDFSGDMLSIILNGEKVTTAFLEIKSCLWIKNRFFSHSVWFQIIKFRAIWSGYCQLVVLRPFLHK